MHAHVLRGESHYWPKTCTEKWESHCIIGRLVERKEQGNGGGSKESQILNFLSVQPDS